MPAGLQRIYGRGRLHLITFSCYRRLPLLKTARMRDILVTESGKLRGEMGFHRIGYVVMPAQPAVEVLSEWLPQYAATSLSRHRRIHRVRTTMEHSLRRNPFTIRTYKK
jgi:hypothetical protein